MEQHHRPEFLGCLYLLYNPFFGSDVSSSMSWEQNMGFSANQPWYFCTWQKHLNPALKIWKVWTIASHSAVQGIIYVAVWCGISWSVIPAAKYWRGQAPLLIEYSKCVLSNSDLLILDPVRWSCHADLLKGAMEKSSHRHSSDIFRNGNQTTK